MPKIIFVNDATEGGALTILRQFLNGIQKYSQKDFVYYVFCSLPELKKFENENIKIINVKAKKWLDRIKWDFWGLKKRSKKNNIKPSLIISFQNTGIKCFNNVFQIIYFHQSLSVYSEPRWNIFNKEERIYWFYQNIYPLFIKISLPKKFLIVIQTQEMKRKVKKKFNLNDDRTTVIPPSFENIDIKLIKSINFNDNKFHIFYPASTALYKNHEIIIKALKYIKDKEPNIFIDLKIHFTFKNDNNRNKQLINLMKSLGVEEVVSLEGKLNYEKVLQFYKSVDLVVFPSYIETFGLPLIEVAEFGLPLLVSDLDFSREIISEYKGAQFLDYKDEKIWAENIVECYRQKPHFKPLRPYLRSSWQTFFELIDNLLK